MAKSHKPWRPDFAGRHGTAWGAVNLCLTVISVTTIEHVFFDAPWWVATVTIGAGIMGTLARAAFSAKDRHPVTVAYQISCWVGAGTWSAWMLLWDSWNVKDLGVRILILGAGVLVAGMLAELGREERQPSTPRDLNQYQRNALGAQYVEIIHRLASHRDLNNPLVEIEAIEEWGHGAGHTVEGRFTSGKFGLRELQSLAPRIALDLGLDEGCGVEVTELAGGSRKVWLMDVTTTNALAKGAPYPADTAGPYSISGMIPVGIKPNGEPIGPVLRQKNMSINGMPGSGKTGGLQATVGSLALTGDCILFGFDATGADLIQPFQRAFLEGNARLPVFSHYADSYEEGAAQMRALMRISHARKMAYGYLKAHHDVSLLPMGVTVRADDLHPGARKFYPNASEERLLSQVMWVGDETTELLRARDSAHPEMSALIAKCMQESRGSGVRFIIPPLGGDDRYIGQQFQKLVHTVVALRMETPPEYKLALGNTYTVDPKDVSVVGTGLWRDDPGASLQRFRFYGEMKQSIVDKIAIRADKLGTIPDLDFISELAANGYQPDGTPWPAGQLMKEGDTGWWDRRWEKLTTGKNAEAVPLSRPVAPVGNTAVLDMDQLRAKVKQVNEETERRISEICAPTETAEAHWVDELIDQLRPPIPQQKSWKDAVMDAIRRAGSDGVSTGDLVDIAGVHRSSVSEYLKQRRESGEIVKVGNGWVLPPDERRVA